MNSAFSWQNCISLCSASCCPLSLQVDFLHFSSLIIGNMATGSSQDTHLIVQPQKERISSLLGQRTNKNRGKRHISLVNVLTSTNQLHLGTGTHCHMAAPHATWMLPEMQKSQKKVAGARSPLGTFPAVQSFVNLCYCAWWLRLQIQQDWKLVMGIWCVQKSTGTAITVNKSPKCSTLMQSQKQQNDLCSFLRQTIQYHSNPSLCPNQ